MQELAFHVVEGACKCEYLVEVKMTAKERFYCQLKRDYRISSASEDEVSGKHHCSHSLNPMRSWENDLASLAISENSKDILLAGAGPGVENIDLCCLFATGPL